MNVKTEQYLSKAIEETKQHLSKAIEETRHIKDARLKNNTKRFILAFEYMMATPQERALLPTPIHDFLIYKINHVEIGYIINPPPDTMDKNFSAVFEVFAEAHNSLFGDLDRILANEDDLKDCPNNIAKSLLINLVYHRICPFQEKLSTLLPEIERLGRTHKLSLKFSVDTRERNLKNYLKKMPSVIKAIESRLLEIRYHKL